MENAVFAHDTDSLQAEDATKILTGSILKLAALIDEHNTLLRRKDQRKEWADISRQPIPEVPATSSSAWNALLRSTMTDVIQPKAEGWRSGLDALLVFLGLFSAIVTAFIVPSLATLKQDEIARTNELLMNITNIMIRTSGTDASNLNLTSPAIFIPEPSDVRFNVYLTLSLIISLSIGALAIACRGFLNLVSWSQHNKAVERLTDIRTRWRNAEKTLGPAIESLPQLLVVPVLLFILGLVDSVFSTALQISSPPTSVLAASSLSVVFIASVAVGMGLTLIDGSLRPKSSPFQSRLAHVLNVSIVQRVKPLAHRLRTAALTTLLEAPSLKSLPVRPAPPLSAESMKIYHEILQATRDDDILDDASAALFNVIGQRTIYANPNRFLRRIPVDLLPQECATLLHLLSPEASVRSHRTAAQVIVDIASNGRTRPLRYSQNDIGRLLPSLSHAARRADPGTSLSVLWNSQFVQAMAIVANSGPNITAYPPAVVFLGARHWSWKYLTPSELCGILAFVFEVIDDKISDELAGADVDEGEQAVVVDKILSSPTLPQRGVAINPRNVLASLLCLSQDKLPLMGRLIPWLVRIHRPRKVIVAAQEHIQMIQRTEWLHLLGHTQFSMVPCLVSTLAEHCLALEGFTENDREQIARICILCLLHTPNIRSRPPAGFVFFARPVLRALLAAVKGHIDLRSAESSDILEALIEIRHSVEEDLMWKDGRFEVLEGFDELLGPIYPGISTRPSSPEGARYAAAEAGRYSELDIVDSSSASE
ncbi:hypothetical protein MVEN_00916800 [Mycena venus]|uniref:DUF6535 domain-containing protein n=1 Tax=Mycena venus TaxID=2733690 RepID=A0A8H6YCL6_9AGAR|nr:hypothetical protein MVEN_00916800 [Mycena venus]